jgi:hypothetical protein
VPSWIAHAGVLQKLTRGALLVLLALADAQNHGTQTGHPSMTTLAKWTGIHRDTVKRAVAELRGHHVISVTTLRPMDPNYKGRNGWPHNVYHIVPVPPNSGCVDAYEKPS